MFGINQTTCVVFTQEGAPVTLAPNEYSAVRSDLKALLAKRRFDLEESLGKSAIVATVELQITGTGPGRSVVGMRVARVDLNPASRGKNTWNSVSSRLVSESAHPSLELAHSLDRTLSPGDMGSGR